MGFIEHYDLDPGCRQCRVALRFHADMGNEEAKALIPVWDKLPLNACSKNKYRVFGGKDRKFRKH